jgi:hypothetical protein
MHEQNHANLKAGITERIRHRKDRKEFIERKGKKGG